MYLTTVCFKVSILRDQKQRKEKRNKAAKAAKGDLIFKCMTLDGILDQEKRKKKKVLKDIIGRIEERELWAVN